MKNVIIIFITSFSFSLIAMSCRDDEKENKETGKVQLSAIRVGTTSLDLNDEQKNVDIPIDQPVVLNFSTPLNVSSVPQAFQLTSPNGTIPITISFLDNDKTVSFIPDQPLINNTAYTLEISDQLKGANGETFPGYSISFKTLQGKIEITSWKFGDNIISGSGRITNVALLPVIEIQFSKPVNPETVNTSNITLSRNASANLTFAFSNDNKTLRITSSQKLKHLTKYTLVISDQVKGAEGEIFATQVKDFYTSIDTVPQQPVITDDALLTLVQQQTFKYFWDLAHPASGMARERNSSGNIVTTGGSGFGLMAIITGIERNFITRTQGIERLDKILDFLETADRFHGAWPHWIDGNTGKVIPFSEKDNGGDLVETSFLIQGLLTFRQYLHATDVAEQSLISRINNLWQSVEWDWYRKNNENVLYWHWSPNYNWDMNFPLYGYFEEQITYLLAASSPTHGIPKIVYTNGYGKNGAIVKNNTYYGIKLPLESPSPLFWVHYSYRGLDPHFSDDYANYWEQNVNASLINHAYCVVNPKNYVGYSDECWGLTSSDNQSGYSAHAPSNDLGVIAPTAALSSFPYTPAESMKALKFFYYKLGDRLWGEYGFYDAFNLTEGWTANSYLAIDQGPIIIMIENYRTGLLWNLFMSAPEVQSGKTTLSFR